ncbi:hypothetical protein M0R45_012247 [Rubus argutus]|uniref:Uncharacterized protein n=1 Tax=Rubus argutus TaxID=59490 RepID=A0AAW1YCJ0_RUBAR
MGIAAPFLPDSSRSELWLWHPYPQYVYQWQCHSRDSAKDLPISKVRLPFRRSSKSHTVTTNNTRPPPFPIPPIKPHQNKQHKYD